MSFFVPRVLRIASSARPVPTEVANKNCSVDGVVQRYVPLCRHVVVVVGAAKNGSGLIFFIGC